MRVNASPARAEMCTPLGGRRNRVPAQVVDSAAEGATVALMSVGLTTSRRRLLPDPDANFGYLFRLAYQRFRTLLEDELEHLGMSVQEYVILSVFETRDELSTSELARITQVTRQTMHTAVLRLENAGLLERQARNQRVVFVGPTKHGRKTLDAANEHVRALEQAALAALSRNDERAVRAWLADLAAMPTRRDMPISEANGQP
jgi:DNA-binding MarR family transcriptional regulator